MGYRAKIKVRFGDEDHAGIVYYPRFFDFFHRAFEDFFDDAGLPYRTVLDGDRLGWPAVRVECDYRKPLRFGDVLDLDVAVRHLGRSSVTFVYRGRKDGEEQLAVEARITNACIDMETFRATPIPERYRALFATILEPAPAT
jgi:4-hydroxybenzoyl-CoA thioesterase